jgi:acetolactate synthase-1/2/3 large subunit
VAKFRERTVVAPAINGFNPDVDGSSSMRFDSICTALEARGIDHVFGVPGTQTLGFFDALRDSGLQFVLASHELGAAFMASGYYRASGRPAVVATIGGPGFTNALTGIAEARLDSVPLLHLVSAPATGPGELFQLQAIDQTGIAGPIVKGCLRLRNGRDPAPVIAAALDLALEGEPGPVLVEFEVDGNGVLDDGVGTKSGAEPSEAKLGRQSDAVESGASLESLRSRWTAAERPVLLVGQGTAAGAPALRQIVETCGVPVVTTPSARGILPEDHPFAMGFDVLRGGLDAVNQLFERSDLIIAIGCKLGHNGSAGFRLHLPESTLVRVDSSPEVLSANFPASLAIQADAAVALDFLAAGSITDQGPGGWTDEELGSYRDRIRRPKLSEADPAIAGAENGRASGFFSWLQKALPRETILVTDSGLHQVVARRWFEILAPRGLILPSDFQSMGFGIPAGIGGRLAAPDRPVAVVVGDGGLLMSGLEITTAVREKLPLLVIVFNDGTLNQIRWQQVRDSGHPFGVELAELEIETFARAIGADYLAFNGTLEAGRLTRVLHGGCPTILEVRVGDSWSMRSRAAGAKLKSVARSVRDSATGGESARRSK